MTGELEDHPASRSRRLGKRHRSAGIHTWAEGDKPREKLIRQGVHQLSDSELLAVIIGSGWGKQSAIDLAREILDLGHRNWLEVGRLSIAKLLTIKGIGEAKAIAISAAIEIGKRRQSVSALTRPLIRSSQDAANILQPLLADQSQEVFCVLFLNQANRVTHMEILSQGGMSGTVVDPRIVFRKALEYEATSLLFCHNHPSGNLNPSEADMALTRKLKEAGKLFDITILDHVIVSHEGYFSLADKGMM